MVRPHYLRPSCTNFSYSVSKNQIGDEGIGILLDGLTNNSNTKMEKLG